MQVEKYICGKNNVSDMEEELCVCVLENIFLYIEIYMIASQPIELQ